MRSPSVTGQRGAIETLSTISTGPALVPTSNASCIACVRLPKKKRGAEETVASKSTCAGRRCAYALVMSIAGIVHAHCVRDKSLYAATRKSAPYENHPDGTAASGAGASRELGGAVGSAAGSGLARLSRSAVGRRRAVSPHGRGATAGLDAESRRAIR